MKSTFSELVLPASAIASARKKRIEALLVRLREAAVFYEDNVPFDSSVSFFNGVLAGFGGLADWTISSEGIGSAGFIVDIAVRFDDAPEYVFFPVRFSNDYWERNPRS